MLLHKLNRVDENFCTFEILDDLVLTSVTGKDNKKYLQGQLTYNIESLKTNTHILCANCHHNGKVQGLLRLFRFHNEYAYIQRKSVVDLQNQELKKYSVFSDVKFEKNNSYVLLGFMGLFIRKVLLNYFVKLPNKKIQTITTNNTVILWFKDPIERFLCIIHKDRLDNLNNFIILKKIMKIKNFWLLLDIYAGIPIFESSIFRKFFPKDMNLVFFNGIDFNKGCYCGQEIISKLHFRNVNHKNMFCLLGYSYYEVEILSILEGYNGKIWKRSGNVSFVYHFFSNWFLLQCIIKNEHIKYKKFRVVSDKKSIFFILNK
ncbi:tRNA-modifying protein YgfZ [Buchnera aphidicola]|uniref:tRNA-modifying protein YgfZ n=1 Tax=Buchnera aphidicola TaxID=9 RepID=UPI003464A42A